MFKRGILVIGAPSIVRPNRVVRCTKAKNEEEAVVKRGSLSGNAL